MLLETADTCIAVIAESNTVGSCIFACEHVPAIIILILLCGYAVYMQLLYYIGPREHQLSGHYIILKLNNNNLISTHVW